MHVTHTSAGGVEGLNRVVAELDGLFAESVADLRGVSEYIIVRSCNRLEVYTATCDNRATREVVGMPRVSTTMSTVMR